MYLYLPLVLVSIIRVHIWRGSFHKYNGRLYPGYPNLVSIILRILFFLSGVIISPDMITGKAQEILQINPILTMIEATEIL